MGMIDRAPESSKRCLQSIECLAVSPIRLHPGIELFALFRRAMRQASVPRSGKRFRVADRIVTHLGISNRLSK
jgi:hypothetical protein